MYATKIKWWLALYLSVLTFFVVFLYYQRVSAAEAPTGLWIAFFYTSTWYELTWLPEDHSVFWYNLIGWPVLVCILFLSGVNLHQKMEVGDRTKTMLLRGYPYFFLSLGAVFGFAVGYSKGMISVPFSLSVALFAAFMTATCTWRFTWMHRLHRVLFVYILTFTVSVTAGLTVVLHATAAVVFFSVSVLLLVIIDKIITGLRGLILLNKADQNTP